MEYDKLQQGIEENIPSITELWEAIQKDELKKYNLKDIEEGMLQKDSWGQTLYHFAACSGHLDKIPKELLTEKNLLDPKGQKTCLHFAAEYGQLEKIPLLRYEILRELQTHFGTDPSKSKKEILAFLNRSIQTHLFKKDLQELQCPNI